MAQIGEDNAAELRESGIASVGAIPWGTHFCQFYETQEELLEILVPYFKAGLESKEFCTWIISGPLTIENAIDAMRNAMQNFDEHVSAKKIEILSHYEWYLTENIFDEEKISRAWTERADRAQAAGFSGLRGAGNLSWAESQYWKSILEYEQGLNDAIQDKKIIILCTYQLSRTNPAHIPELTHCHQHVVLKGKGDWEILEDRDAKELQADLKRRNYELEQKIAERTEKLEKTVLELKKEIAERIKIAEELKRSESRYRTLIEQASDAIIITDQKGILVEVNGSFCKMVGFAENELIGMAIANLIPPEHLKLHPLRFDLLLEGKSFYQEREMMRKDGGIFPVEEQVKMLDDKRILAIVRDITERKRAEDILRRSEDRVRRMIDTIPTMAWTMEPDGVVDYANKRWMEFAGKKAFKDPKNIIHPDDYLRVMQTWRLNQLAGEPYDDEMRLRAIDGNYRWFIVRTAPFRNEHGEILKWYGVSIDIEDKKRAQDELRLAYQRLSYHVDNTPLAVIEWDKDLNIKRWSARATEIFGWTPQEAIGINRYDHNFRLVYEDDNEAVNKIDVELMNGLVDRNVSINRNYTKDGKVIYCEWHNSVLRDDQGNVLTILSLVHDVTDRKKADETLQHSYDQIRQLTEHLQNIREEERTHIAREIHDELGGQLTALKMDAAWLNQKLGKEEKAVRLRIKNIVSILGAMLKSVRRISSQLRPSLLDNLGLVAAMEWYLTEFENRLSIKVTFEKPNNELEIPDAIKNGLFRIFQESLTNVARHSGAKTVKINLMKKHEQLVLSIVDDGKGFDPQKAPKDKTLGILGMKERTMMLGGSYDITGLPGKGTSVTVTLPYITQNVEKK
jgi:PAS domain S-box-containing protein